MKNRVLIQRRISVSSMWRDERCNDANRLNTTTRMNIEHVWTCSFFKVHSLTHTQTGSRTLTVVRTQSHSHRIAQTHSAEHRHWFRHSYAQLAWLWSWLTQMSLEGTLMPLWWQLTVVSTVVSNQLFETERDSTASTDLLLWNITPTQITLW